MSCFRLFPPVFFVFFSPMFWSIYSPAFLWCQLRFEISEQNFLSFQDTILEGQWVPVKALWKTKQDDKVGHSTYDMYYVLTTMMSILYCYLINLVGHIICSSKAHSQDMHIWIFYTPTYMHTKNWYIYIWIRKCWKVLYLMRWLLKTFG